MFSVSLLGADEFIERLDAMSPTIQAALAAKAHQLAVNLQGHIVREKLSGQVLKQRSGDLAGSIQQEVITEGLKVFGRVFSAGNVKYAAFWEYGFHGTETVKAHVRSMVFGKEVAPFTVGSFERRVNQDARSFMRSSLLEMKAQIVEGLRDAVERGARQALKG